MRYLKHLFANTWLFPRYIGTVYMRPAMEQAKFYASGKMLDIGCGLRQYEDIFADSVSLYIGVDRPALLESAAPHVIGDALQIPLADGSADTVLATELMEHLPDSDQFLAGVARVLRPEGYLILSIPFIEPLHEEPRDFYRFTPYGLRTLLNRHGFAVESLEAKGGWFSVMGYFISHLVYEWANPTDQTGHRRYRLYRLPLVALALVICACAQLLGYKFDQLFKTPRYALGYVVVARRITDVLSSENVVYFPMERENV